MTSSNHLPYLFVYLLICCYLVKKVECLHAAVELTHRLLTRCGQGVNASPETIQHSVYSLQVERL